MTYIYVPEYFPPIFIFVSLSTYKYKRIHNLRNTVSLHIVFFSTENAKVLIDNSFVDTEIINIFLFIWNIV